MTEREPNNLDDPVVNFCLQLERYRRGEGRSILTAKAFREALFPMVPVDPATDPEVCFFSKLPKDVRGPILSDSWRIRGKLSALRDSAAEVSATVLLALIVGDLDDERFEEGIAPEILISWTEPEEWWRIFRSGNLEPKHARHILATAYEKEFFDAEWFFENAVSPHDPRSHGIAEMAVGMNDGELTDWLVGIWQLRDATPLGFLKAAHGLVNVVAHMQDETLLALVDLLAIKLGLARGAEPSADASMTEKTPEADDEPALHIGEEDEGEEAEEDEDAEDRDTGEAGEVDDRATIMLPVQKPLSVQTEDQTAEGVASRSIDWGVFRPSAETERKE